MFNSARLKITAWYLLIIMIISLAFSLVIYRLLSMEIERFALAQQFRIERRFNVNELLPPPVVFDMELVNDVKNRLILNLIVINSTILLVSGVLSFFLAGRTLKPIKNMVDEQNRFISDASHEFRTPLTSLKSAMEVYLRDPKLKLSDAKQLIKENIDEVNRLQLLSDKLLKLAQFQKPNSMANFAQVTLKSIITQAVRQTKPMAKLKKIKIISQSPDLKFLANQTGLTDLLVILLDNAIKYSPEHKSIKISAKKYDGNLEISVTDHGIGIEPSEIPHIFDRFYRADSARSKINATGYGLGLSIAKKIVDIHRGQISVVSQPKKGSTFTVKIPTKFFS